MNTKHTPGPLHVFSVYAQHEVRTPMDTLVAVANSRDDARLFSAAPDLLQELKKRADNAEQSAFEEWLRRTTPSGDAESVHRQWKESSEFSDFADEWGSALDALAKATGASHVSQQ